MSEAIRGELHHHEPLSLHTSLRVGGPADILVVPRDLEEDRADTPEIDWHGTQAKRYSV